MVQVGPEVDRNVEDAQYVATVAQGPGETDPLPADFGGYHYVFARLDQTTVSANLRINVSFTPTLSLQTFIQPLISSGRYSDYKQLARSRSYDFTPSSYDPESGTVYPVAGDTRVGEYVGPTDFNYKTVRGNAVLRWEYRPGSALFFVWTQERTDSELFDGLELGRSVRRLGTTKPSNILLVKLTYYLGM